MRRIFSSPRLENCETVRDLLVAAGIETRLTADSPLKRATKRDFSYTDRSGSFQWPAVWVIKADDYARARQLLREHGVPLPTTRETGRGSFLPGARADPAGAQPAPVRTANRVRYVLLALATALAVLTALRIIGVL